MAPKPTYEELAQRVQALESQALDLRHMEKTIGESEHRLKAVFEANPDPMIVYNTKGHPQMINPAFTKIFGWSLDDLRNRPIPFVPEDQKEKSFKKIAELYETGVPLAFETDRLTKSGELVNTIISAALVKDANGQPAGMVVNLRDVTAQIKFEEQFQQTKKIEAIGQLAGGVAHDFNNMLSPIIGYAEILMMDFDPGHTAYRQLNEIKKAAERSRDLVQKLLAFSRKQTLNLKVVNLGQIIEGLLAFLERTLREDIELIFKSFPEDCLVKADMGQVEQVLMNLAVNARDAMVAGGKLSIEIARQNLDREFCARQPDLKPGPYVVLSVADTGSGIDAQTRRYIFDPFFTTKGQGGTGLGLATVYGIVKQHGGAVTVESERGQGTVFKIFFPAVGGQVDAIDTPLADHGNHSGTESILVVEDNHMVRNLACDMLRRHGYSVMDAASGPAAVELIDRYGARPQLLLTDVIMPDMNGKQLFQRLVQTLPGLKVLYMSGYTGSAIASHGVLDDSISLIPKPFTIASLAAAVRRVLDTA